MVVEKNQKYMGGVTNLNFILCETSPSRKGQVENRCIKLIYEKIQKFKNVIKSI